LYFFTFMFYVYPLLFSVGFWCALSCFVRSSYFKLILFVGNSFYFWCSSPAYLIWFLFFALPKYLIFQRVKFICILSYDCLFA
jgi:hypothetical protein